MIRDVPYAVITLLSYEILQDMLKNSTFEKKLKNLIFGSVAGGIGTFLTTPMDLVKTRMMVGGDYSGFLAAVVGIYEKEGIAAFLIGMGPRMAHKIPANGVFFFFYEIFRSVLGVSDQAYA